jgi:ABC-2 type transport system permease protein
MLSGRFDLAFVVVHLLPLVIIALSYGMLAGERESGTLALALSQSVSLRKVLVGKIVARFAIVMAPLTAVTVALGAALGTHWTATALVLWIACVATYSAFWLTASAFANATGWNSRTNAVALASAWLALVLVLPAVLNVTAKALHPAPSRAEMIQRTRELQTLTRRPVELLERYYREHPDQLPEGVDIQKYNFPLQWTILQIEMDKGMAPMLDAVDTGLERQHSFVTGAGMVSPALILQNALNDLAGTGFARQRSFWRQVIAFHQEHRRYFEPKTLAHVKLRVDDYLRMPRFRFQDELFSEVTRRVAASLVLIAAVTVLLLVGTALRLRAYPVVV